MTASNAGTVEFKRASTMFPLHPLATALALLMVSWQLDSFAQTNPGKQTNCSLRELFQLPASFKCRGSGNWTLKDRPKAAGSSSSRIQRTSR